MTLRVGASGHTAELMNLQHCLRATVRRLSFRSTLPVHGTRTSAVRVTDLILAGDIFPAHIAQRFSARLSTSFDPLAFYCRLRSLNPAPFAALLRYDKLTIASSSPERFLRLDGRKVETRPIKGTIARSAVPNEDRRLGELLLASEKDLAENVMIVDLLRNDLSRVCTADSIDVPALCNLESYASVHHLVSIVTGSLRDSEDAITLLQACFSRRLYYGSAKDAIDGNHYGHRAGLARDLLWSDRFHRLQRAYGQLILQSVP